MGFNRRRSFIWSLEKSTLEQVVKNSNSIAQVLKELGVVLAKGSYTTLRKRMDEDSIDYSHIPVGKDSNKGRKFNKKGTPLSEVLVEHSQFTRGSLKKKLLKEGILKNECCLCHLSPEWEGKKLIMVLDHINGVHNDNRLENLRLLCPNCNSQTSTFCGKNTKTLCNKKQTKNKQIYLCTLCKKQTKKSKYGKTCKNCSSSLQKRKVENRPSIEVLLLQVAEHGYCATGRLYGVTDNAIRKWIKSAQKFNQSSDAGSNPAESIM
jgi:hypothetical protein